MASKRESKTKIAESLNYRTADFQRAKIQRLCPPRKARRSACCHPTPGGFVLCTRTEKTAKDQPGA